MKTWLFNAFCRFLDWLYKPHVESADTRSLDDDPARREELIKRMRKEK
jgi:hypothetical protein